MRCLEKPFRINIPQRKERNERSIFYKNVYGTDIKPRLTDTDASLKTGKNLSMVMDLLTVFFLFTRKFIFS